VWLLKMKMDSIKRERDQLQDLSWRLKEENEQSARQLKNARATLVLDKGIQKSLMVAAKAAKMILELDKVQLIQKHLEHLSKGKAQSFMKLYKSMQHFSNDIIKVQEGLERELQATRDYLQVKHQPAVEQDQEEEKKGKEVIKVASSDSEEGIPAGIRKKKLDGSSEAMKASERGPDADKQVVPFRTPEKKSEPEAGRAGEYISLQDKPAKDQRPMVAQIHKESLAKYPGTLPHGPMSMASGSPAFLAIPTASKPDFQPPLPKQLQQEDQRAS
jgi:hypothetical protein